jgi:long-chain acyl-CoA synthetase
MNGVFGRRLRSGGAYRPKPPPVPRSDVIPAAEAGTLPGLFRARVACRPDGAAYRQYARDQGVWRDYTWKDMDRRVVCWRAALAAQGLAQGERVAILLPNGVEWVTFDQAALSLGLVVVPLYTTDTPGNLAYILADSGARVLLAESRDQWETLSPFAERLDRLDKIIVVRGAVEAAGRVVSLHAWLDLAAPPVGAEAVRPDSPATIVYTSGTTGPPKGVVQSHRAILWNAEAVLRAVPGYADDVFLSFLPLSHSFERTVGYYVPMMAGACVAYARSVKELPEDLLTVRPTIMLAVPRVFERIYAALQHQVEEKGYTAKWLFAKAVDIGYEHFEHGQGRAPRPALQRRMLWPVLRGAVAAKLQERLGGRLRVVVSGGAPLSPRVGRCFAALGVPLIQGYGLTEASPVVSVNRLQNNVPESVGEPLPGVEIRLGESGELLVRAPSVMLGYWNRPEDTRLAIDDRGWLHTGDRAELMEGRIYLRGRVKDILVLSTGEKVSPGDLELTITQDPLFEQAMAVGEGVPYVGALVVLSRSGWYEIAASAGLDPDDETSLQAAAARRAVLERLAPLLAHLPRHAQVRAVHLQLETWTVENELLTPTMKLKRVVIQERFREAIRDLYAGHDVPF